MYWNGDVGGSKYYYSGEWLHIYDSKLGLMTLTMGRGGPNWA